MSASVLIFSNFLHNQTKQNVINGISESKSLAICCSNTNNLGGKCETESLAIYCSDINNLGNKCEIIFMKFYRYE